MVNIDYDRCIQLIRSGKISLCAIYSDECLIISDIKYIYIHQNNFVKLNNIVLEANNNQIKCRIVHSELLPKLINEFYKFVTIDLEIYGRQAERKINNLLESKINYHDLRLYLLLPRDDILYILDYVSVLLECKKINRFIATYEHTSANVQHDKNQIYLKKIISHHIMQHKKYYRIENSCYIFMFVLD